MKILHLDIETAPHLAMVWGLWQETVVLDRLEKPGYTLCWAAKWHHKPTVMSAWHTDKHCFTALHALIEEADAVCTYNGKKFDIPTLNKEFLLAGLSRPAPAKQIDLYQTVRSRFRFASNKLDFVSQQLGLGSKVKHRGFELWRDCMADKPAARKEMLTYNKQDVVLLGKLYDRLEQWIPTVPSQVKDGVCGHCGSENLQKRGTYKTTTRTYQRYQCNDCGHWGRDAKGIK